MDGKLFSVIFGKHVAAYPSFASLVSMTPLIVSGKIGLKIGL